MLTSKQRSQLKSIAQNEDTIIMVGKSGVNDTLITSVNDALKAREIVKGRVLEKRAKRRTILQTFFEFV